MTNFERWKESLTPDDVLDILTEQRFVCGLDCPAAYYCAPHDERIIDPLTDRCKRKFNEWANRES